MSAVARMIEVAQKEPRYDGNDLVVLDGLAANRESGVRCVVWFDGNSFVAETLDGCGRGMLASATQRLDAVTRSLDGYLDIVNNGI